MHLTNGGPPAKVNSCAAPASKKRKASGARGIGTWVEVSFVVGELKGDAGKSARERAMLLDDVVEAAFHVKVLFGYELKGADWIQKKLDGEDNPDQSPLARRGEDGKTKYIKLSADEKQTVVQVYDSLLAAGWSVRETIKHMHEKLDRYRNVSASSISSWRKAQAAGSHNERKAGAPPVVLSEIKDQIEEKVCDAHCLVPKFCFLQEGIGVIVTPSLISW